MEPPSASAESGWTDAQAVRNTSARRPPEPVSGAPRSANVTLKPPSLVRMQSANISTFLISESRIFIRSEPAGILSPATSRFSNFTSSAVVSPVVRVGALRLLLPHDISPFVIEEPVWHPVAEQL